MNVLVLAMSSVLQYEQRFNIGKYRKSTDTPTSAMDL